MMMKKRQVGTQLRPVIFVICPIVEWTVLGVLGDPGANAPSPVLERMESLGKNPVCVNVLLLNSGGKIVIQLGLKRSSPVQEKALASLSVQ